MATTLYKARLGGGGEWTVKGFSQFAISATLAFEFVCVDESILAYEL